MDNAETELIFYLLSRRQELPLSDWTVQGFGFMRLRINQNMRLHIWDSRLRVPNVSDIHDHAQWAFTSQIISGQLVNTRYVLTGGITHRGAILNCGIGGGMNQSLGCVGLLPGEGEIYLPGMQYRQEPEEIHRTEAIDGTVTLIRQERRNTNTARVFWNANGEWIDAIPRQATVNEVDLIGYCALAGMQK